MANLESEGNESSQFDKSDGFKTPRKRKSKTSNSGTSKCSSSEEGKPQRTKQKTESKLKPNA